MKKFVGRQDELELLELQRKQKKSSLVIIKGRRRIGKSRLAKEFGKQFDRMILLAGLPPTHQTTHELQLQEFERQLHRYQVATLRNDDWGHLLWQLSENCKRGSVLIILDEISWMGSKDPDFLGKLKTIWDQHFSDNPDLMLLLSGSQSTWIEQNILSSTGFVGRVSLTIDLQELTLPDCRQFWNRHVSPYEIFKVLAVTGGVPRYLEEIDPHKPAEQNLFRLCFQKSGLLYKEFEQIFSDLFTRRSKIYKEVVMHLVDGPKSLQELSKLLHRPKSGDLGSYLKDLCQTGFVSRDYTWAIGKGEASASSVFRLSDNYVRFYLKYIDPQKKRIEIGDIQELPPHWRSLMGLQFENLVVNNKQHIFRVMGIRPSEVLFAKPYFQNQTKKRQACQIDFLIQTRFNVLYVCEIKFSTHEVPHSVVADVEEKIKRLDAPKGTSIRPALIHVNGISRSIHEERYFAEIVDFSELLN